MYNISIKNHLTGVKDIIVKCYPYQMLMYGVMFILSFVLKLEIIGTQSTINNTLHI